MNKLSKMSLALLVGTAFALGLTPHEAESATGVLRSGSNCVAYKTRKTVAAMSESNIVGTNCNVTVKAVKVGANLKAEISIPISSFNSNERDRDTEVSKILKAGSQSSLLVTTEALPLAKWQQMVKRGSGLIRAQIKIGGRSYSIATTAKAGKVGGQLEVSGVIMTKFTALGIRPPEYGPGGIIAKAPDYLELHYNFMSGSVQNRSSVPGL